MPESESNEQNRLSHGEMITAITHYFRAEAARSLAWRERLDRTTNWAVGATAAFLGFGFSHPEITHTFFLFGLAIIYILLFVEARRYRFYDAYEYRVRLLHQNFIYGVLTGRLDVEPGSYWLAELASDLRFPQYKMGLAYALGHRLYANYVYLFAVLLAGWLVKIKLHPVPVRSWEDYLGQAAIGGLSGWFVFAFILAFIIHAAILIRIGRRPRGGRDVIYGRRARPEDSPSDES